MPRVVISSALPVDLGSRLGSVEVVAPAPGEGAMSRAALLAAARDADGLICLLSDRIDEELLAAAPKLKVVANYAVGYDNIDVREATKKKVPVSNTPGVLTETTADLAWTLIMAVARRLVEADHFMRTGKYTSWAPMLLLGQDVNGKHLKRSRIGPSGLVESFLRHVI